MRAEAKKWFVKAEHDLSTSQYNFQGNKLDAAIFYAQQAAEKALKSLIIQQKGIFPHIHDLVKLSSISKAPENIIANCSIINPAYTASRYPDVGEEFSTEDCNEILKASKEVVAWVKKKMS